MRPMANTRTVSFEREEDEIDLLELARVIWGKAWLVILGAALGTVLAFCFTRFMITPQYKATSTIYIFSKTTSITSLADLQIGSQLTGDFRIITTTRDVIEGVIADLGLNEDYDSLVKKVSVENPASTHMLSITVTHPDPALAADISNTLSDRLRDQISDIMNTDRPSVVERAVVPSKQASPSTMRNTVIGALLGALLVIAVVLVQYMLDDTVRTKEDVAKHLGLNTLAEFPYLRGQDKKANPAKRLGKSKNAGKTHGAA